MTAEDHTKRAPSADADLEFPPAPWDLHGQAHWHLLAVRADALPLLPEGFKPLVIARRGFVAAGWVDYQGGSILRYGELFAAVAGFANRRLTATVTHMWVDSDASRKGGRELWGYPKELAEFELQIRPEGTAIARDEHGELARGTFRSWFTLPFGVKARSGTVQPLDGRLKAVKSEFRGTPVLGRGTLEPSPEGPMAFLSSARNLLSVGLRDFHFSFGIDD